MSSTKDGMMVILSSPSGAGKTTLVKKISLENNFQISISHTTRPPSTNEINGKDYFFVNKGEFEVLIKIDEFSVDIETEDKKNGKINYETINWTKKIWSKTIKNCMKTFLHV